jgi:hypothetical protein
VPAAAVLAGLGVVAGLALRRSRTEDEDRAEELVSTIAPGDQARIAADLRRFAQESSE